MSFKRKSDIIKALTELFSNPELKEAGIQDALEYIIPDLTAKELTEYLKWARGPLSEMFNKIKALRKQAPDHAWKNYKLFGLSNTETRYLKDLHKELVKVWKTKPKFQDRVIDDPSKKRETKKNNEGFDKDKQSKDKD